MKMNSLLQVASYSFSSNPSLRIFQRESPPNAPIQHILIAEPLLDWQRDDQGRPLINAVSRVQGGGAVFELRLIISTMESQQAAQRAVSAKPRLAEMELITQIDSVNLALAKGNMGELLEFTGGEMYPSRNENVVLVDFESSSLTANEGNIEKVRSILRNVRLNCKASVNGHELPAISLDFSTLAPSSIASPPSSSGGAAAINDVVAVTEKSVYREFRAPHSPRTLKLEFPIILRLAWTRSGNLIATTGRSCFYILSRDGKVIRQIAGGIDLCTLTNTHGVAVSDEGHVFIADYQTHRVTVYTEEGKFLRSFGGPGDGIGQFSGASSIAISKKTGNLFVADYNNHRVQVFDQAGKFLYLFGNPHLNGPYGIDIDDDDNVFVAEYSAHRISAFTSEGQFLRSFGFEGSAPGRLKNPYELHVDRRSGHILVADFLNNRIQVFNKFGAVVNVIPTGMQTTVVLTDNDGKVIVAGNNSTMLVYDN